MALTWTDMPLTANQRTKMLELEAIGIASRTESPDISGVTYSQVKASIGWFKDVDDLLRMARAGAEYVKRVRQAERDAAYEAANP